MFYINQKRIILSNEINIKLFKNKKIIKINSKSYYISYLIEVKNSNNNIVIRYYDIFFNYIFVIT